MALTIKVLGQGTIGATAANNELLTSYTGNAVPANKAVIVKNIRLVNQHTAVRKVTINYLPAGANPRAVSPVNLELPVDGLVILDDELMLESTDKLRASFDAAGGNNVDFVIGGVERDQ